MFIVTGCLLQRYLVWRCPLFMYVTVISLCLLLIWFLMQLFCVLLQTSEVQLYTMNDIWSNIQTVVSTEKKHHNIISEHRVFLQGLYCS